MHYSIAFLAPLIFSCLVQASPRLLTKPFGPQVQTRTWVQPESFASIAPQAVAEYFIREHAPADPGFGFRITHVSRTQHNGLTHVHAVQTFENVEIENAIMAVHVDGQGQILTASSSFFTPPAESDLLFQTSSESNAVTVLQPEQVLRMFMSTHMQLQDESKLNEMHVTSVGDVEAMESAASEQWVVANVDGVVAEGVPIVSKYLVSGDQQQLVPVYDLEVQTENGDHWLKAYADKSSGTLLQLVDWVTLSKVPEEFKYRAYPLHVMTPLDGEQTIVVNPQDSLASPLGWHNTGNEAREDTVGNNVWAQHNPLGRSDFKAMYRPRGHVAKNGTLTFDFSQNLNETSKSVDNAVTNLFVRINYLHDLFYHAGFDEVSGNFQDTNFGRGGKEGDGVIAMALDGTYMNNADFATPPDGRRGRMRMFLWNIVKPIRDGDYDNAIITHEFAHGVSNRLTGGPMNSNCLGRSESGGMGEGWGDAFALYFGMRPEHTVNSSHEMGVFVYGSGIRNYPYSTVMLVNPHVYSDIKPDGEVHTTGETWAVTLLELFWTLVEKHGIEYDWHKFKDAKLSSPKSLPGNFLAFQLVVDGMKLQPCRPTFLQARDAILNADRAGFDGKNQCLIWKAFAKRGMGADAKEGGHNGFRVPEECR